MMKQLDSNIVIDAGRTGSDGLRVLGQTGPFAISSATLVEVLGFHRLSDERRGDFETFFDETTILVIDDRVIQKAITLRQARKMSLGDALIVATALVHGLPLVTRNTKDFAWIDGLILIDPDTSP